MTKRHRILPPVYFLLAVLVLAMVGRPHQDIFAAPFDVIGALLVVAGCGAVLWAAGLFRGAGTPIKPFSPSTALVTGGLYKFTRNPMYLGMILALLGVAIGLGTASAFIAIPLFVWQIRRKFVQPEEVFLEGIFGADYVAYKARVRRWL